MSRPHITPEQGTIRTLPSKLDAAGWATNFRAATKPREHDTMNTDLDQRITFNPRQCGGQACIRGLRIRVTDILEMLAQGVDQSEILDDFPDLEAADILACLHFAAKRAGIARLAA